MNLILTGTTTGARKSLKRSHSEVSDDTDLDRVYEESEVYGALAALEREHGAEKATMEQDYGERKAALLDKLAELKENAE